MTAETGIAETGISALFPRGMRAFPSPGIHPVLPILPMPKSHSSEREEAAFSPRLPPTPPLLLTPGLSRLRVLPSRRFSALDSTWEGSEKGSECLLDNSLPAHGSAAPTPTAGALGMGLPGHRSPWRLEGSGGGLSLLLGQSLGVQGSGRRCGRLSVPSECGRSGGGGGGRSRSVGGMGRGLSLCRAPGAACGVEQSEIVLSKGSLARRDKQEGGAGSRESFGVVLSGDISTPSEQA